MISLENIKMAVKVLKDNVIGTPLIYSPTFSRMVNAEVYLKLENLQMGGSFKIRGATYKIQSHLDEVRQKGVVAASIGNHAQGVAIAAKAAGVPATIVMPVWASITKQEATREYGAELILKGQNLTEAISFAHGLAEESGRLFIHPYDDPEVIAGQGTIGLEILEDLPDPDMILVPVGGGGLIAGIATAVKALRPETCVIGVQVAASPSACEALKAGRPVALSIDENESLADAIMVPQVGEADFPVLQDLVDDIIVVNEDQIATSMLLLLERKKILVEGAGATPLAALLSHSLEITKGSKIVLVISGGNLDSLLLDRVVHQGLLQHGRLMQFSVYLEDVPGSLAKLLDLVAKLQANAISIRHTHNEKGMPINFIRVDLDLETRSFGHITEITTALNNAGYRIDLK